MVILKGQIIFNYYFMAEPVETKAAAPQESKEGK